MRQKTNRTKSSLGSKRGKGKAATKIAGKTARIAGAKRVAKKKPAARKARTPRAAKTAASLL